MIEAGSLSGTAEAVESVLRGELSRGDAVLGTIAPIMRHLLANDDNSVFSDDVIARVRGMTADIAVQLLDAIAEAGGAEDRVEHSEAEVATLSSAITGNSAFLCHVHALALEWQLTERLQQRLAVDPVLSPLVQALIASPDTATAGLAMNLLASQARFCQAQRRMKLALNELPGDLLHCALLAMRTLAGTHDDERAAKAEAAIRAAYDEAGSRLGLLSRAVTGMGGGAVAALSVTHAGAALFLTALSLASGQDRDLAATSTNESQVARLALGLIAAGLKSSAVEEQFLSLHPDIALPDGFDRLGADRAAALLTGVGTLAGL
jgi:hypothetical protein